MMKMIFLAVPHNGPPSPFHGSGRLILGALVAIFFFIIHPAMLIMAIGGAATESRPYRAMEKFEDYGDF